MSGLGAALSDVGSYLIYPAAFLFVLCVVVFFHELGHFLVGRWCGVGVTTFSIGFGRELVGWNDRHGTRWKISAIPLGGYVKFVGDMNAASTPDDAALSTMSAAERSVSFHHKPLWQRAAIVAAGPIANFLLAIVIFSGLTYISGRHVLTPRAQAVQTGTAAEAAGFKAGDLVLAIDGRPVDSFEEMKRIVSGSAGETLAILVERDGQKVQLEATPKIYEEKTIFGTQRIGLLGLQGSRDPADVKHVTYGPLGSLQVGVGETWNVVDRTFDYLHKLVVGRESADQLSGPLRIAQVSGTVAKVLGFGALVSLIAILSVSIGLINLFPVPMLDGGHLLFYVFEAVLRRPLSERAQEIGFRIGLALVVMLMLFATWNDIVHLGTRGT